MVSQIDPPVVPKPPDSADPHEMLKWAQDMYTWVTTHFPQGILAPFFTQDQINAMTSTEQCGRIFFNYTTGKFMGGEVVSGALSVKTFTTS